MPASYFYFPGICHCACASLLNMPSHKPKTLKTPLFLPLKCPSCNAQFGPTGPPVPTGIVNNGNPPLYAPRALIITSPSPFMLCLALCIHAQPKTTTQLHTHHLHHYLSHPIQAPSGERAKQPTDEVKTSSLLFERGGFLRACVFANEGGGRPLIRHPLPQQQPCLSSRPSCPSPWT